MTAKLPLVAIVFGKRVLKEGGYEADSSMIYYGKPGPFAESVEDQLMATLYKVMKDVGRKKQ